MENKELKKILSEITDHTNKGMAANLTVKAMRDTIARYPHDPVEHTIIRALLEQLDEQVAEFSSIWWRIREIEKLGTESEVNDTDNLNAESKVTTVLYATTENPTENIKDEKEVSDAE